MDNNCNHLIDEIFKTRENKMVSYAHLKNKSTFKNYFNLRVVKTQMCQIILPHTVIDRMM